MNIAIKRLSSTAIIPTRGSTQAAGYDLYACRHGNDNEHMDEPFVVRSNATIKIPTGIAVAIPDGYFGALFARSGLSINGGLRPANCVGVIDSDYRGEIIVALHNDSCTNQIIHHGDRIAQLVLMKYQPIEFEEVAELDSTKRGIGGFGSTGL